MIIVAGTMTLDPAVIAEFGPTVATLAVKVRAEDGCEHYSLLVEDAASGLINVLEMWRDEPALRVHLNQPWIVAFLGRFGGAVKVMDIKIYDVASVRPMAM